MSEEEFRVYKEATVSADDGSNGNGDKTLRFLGLTKNQFALGGFLAFMVLMGLVFLLFLQVRSLAASNTKSLCATRAYYEEQVKTSDKYLEDHPNANDPVYKTLGLTRKQVEATRDRQVGLVTSLRFTDCPAPKSIPEEDKPAPPSSAPTDP